MSAGQSSPVFTEAVLRYWQVRKKQGTAQRNRGVSDTGSRTDVTGGRHMDGFSEKIVEQLINIGVNSSDIFTRKKMEIPGFYRPQKKWDLLVVPNGKLIAVVELKSLAGELGKNFNNRAEEAIGNSVDFWTAYREAAFGASPQPWLGYLFLLEDGPEAHKLRRVRRPHFNVLKEFEKTSYADRCELLCRKMVLERKYNSACLILSDPNRVDEKENYNEPASDLSADQFLAQLFSHVKGQILS